MLMALTMVLTGQTPANLIGTLNQNIIQVNDYNSGYQRTNQIIGNITLDYKINSWLTFQSFGGYGLSSNPR